MSPELAGKRLEILRELVPALKRVAVLRNPANRAEDVAVRLTQAAAHEMGISVSVAYLAAPNEFDQALAALAQDRTQALIVLPDPMFNEHREALVPAIARSRIPAIYMETTFAATGALISYGPNYAALFRRSADYVDKLLHGAKPIDLPIEQPTKFDLIVSLRTAKQLGLDLPRTLLVRADELIE